MNTTKTPIQILDDKFKQIEKERDQARRAASILMFRMLGDEYVIPSKFQDIVESWGFMDSLTDDGDDLLEDLDE